MGPHAHHPLPRLRPSSLRSLIPKATLLPTPRRRVRAIATRSRLLGAQPKRPRLRRRSRYAGSSAHREGQRSRANDRHASPEPTYEQVGRKQAVEEDVASRTEIRKEIDIFGRNEIGPLYRPRIASCFNNLIKKRRRVGRKKKFRDERFLGS